MATTVVGVFDNDSAAQSAVNQLRDAGVMMDNISVIARPSGDIVNETGEVIDVPDDHMTAGEGLTIGAVWGGLVGLAALAIPGIGPVITSNVFAAALTGAVAGAATGGIAGALIDAASVPEEHARVYEDRVRAGSTLVTAQVDDSMADQARSILQTSGAHDFDWNNPDTLRTGADQSDEAAYADSSKVGTVGGGAAGAITGAAIGAAGGPIGAVIGGVAGAVTGGSVGAVGDTIGEKAEDDIQNDVSAVDRYDQTGPNYMTGADADLNKLDNVGYVAEGAYGGSGQTAEEAYDDSSKVGTVGGGAAGAMTGAAMGAAGGPVGAVIGGVAGAVVGGATGAAGDTAGEMAEDSVQGDTTSTDRYDATTQPNYVASTTRDDMTTLDDRAGATLRRAGDRIEDTGDYVADRTRDAFTDDQRDDTFQAADQAYDDSSKAGTAGGALAGAATGAAIGSAGGPVGTVVGGVAGAISGAAAGAVGDTIGEEADSETGAFSDANKAQYRDATRDASDTARDAGNYVERKTDLDIDRDGDVGQRH